MCAIRPGVAPNLAALRGRFLAGGVVTVAEVAEAAGLSGREMPTLTERMAGRSFGEIATDAPMAK